jgi:hypothetical protein
MYTNDFLLTGSFSAKEKIMFIKAWRLSAKTNVMCEEKKTLDTGEK